MHHILFLYLALSFGLFLLQKKTTKSIPFFPALLQLGAFVFFMGQLPEIIAGKSKKEFFHWIPALGLNIEFSLDGLSIVFTLLITAIGFLVFIYAKAYMKSYSGVTKFYFYLTLFSAAMLGLVLSVNFIQLFIFWELTSVLSFLLISFFNEKETSRKAAFQSLFITGFGGLALLAGIILIGSIVDSYSLSDWIDHSDEIKASKLYLPSLLLILTGAFTKSAQFPFHFWLPGAMQAPTPVSAYLHSATMVKAGVFLLMRLNPVLGGTSEWICIIPVIGALTMLIGSYLSITQTDIKAILAYTTISALGVLVLLLGIDTKLSVKAALVFLFVHAFYKAALFMVAGYIDKKTGTREIDRLGGLVNFIPFGFAVSTIALFSMAGLPPLLGFVGKELIYEAKVQSPGIASLILILGIASNIFMVAVSLLFLKKVFLGKAQTAVKQTLPYENMFLVGPGILALLSLGFGLFPNTLSSIIEPALRIICAEDLQVNLKLWHGFNLVLLLSLLTVLTGFILFYVLIKYKNILIWWRRFNSKVFSIDFSEVFSKVIERFVGFSAQNTKIIQHGVHRYYILTVILFTSLLLWFQLYVTRGWQLNTSLTIKPLYVSGLIGVVVLSTLFSTLSKSRISTIIAMGVTGYGISLIYLYYSAVDLAITQIIIETLTVVVFVLVLRNLPKFANLSSRKTRLRDAVIALGFGGVMMLLALKAINVEFNHPISDFFIENSFDKAYGKNVVNVILVDFRAFDTLGEIVVLSIAALGVGVLIKTKTQNR